MITMLKLSLVWLWQFKLVRDEG